MQTQLVLPGEQDAPEETTSLAEVRAQAIDGKSHGSVPEQRRSQIFQAASNVFGKKGYANTSVRDIADAAGMPVPTMYQYFRSKEDILSLLFDTYMREIGKNISAAVNGKIGAAEKLKAAIGANLAMYDKYRRQIRLMYQETRTLNAANRERALGLTRATNALWIDLIRQGVASGEFREIECEVVANFIPMLCATWVLRRWNMRQIRLEQLQEALTDMVINGLARKPNKPARTRERVHVSA
jgi:AcrR family transcriptional regulator